MLLNRINIAIIVLILAQVAFSADPLPIKSDIIPDLTKTKLEDQKKDFQLGPTGLRGWMYVRTKRISPQDYTSDKSTGFARQILVTDVEKGSPAEGIVSVGDVILGIGKKEFNRDPRFELANAINESEKKINKGDLKLLIWRPNEPDNEILIERYAGMEKTVTLTLKVLGTYSAMAPYDCPKSKLLFQETAEVVFLKETNTNLGIWALALLATGEKKYFEKVKAVVQGYVKSSPDPSPEAVNKGRGWGWSYKLILMCEYYLLTKDETVLPGIKKLAVTLSMGQSNSGAWGHYMAMPRYNKGRMHGRLEGYSALNQPGLTCFMGLALAKKCGVKHPELTLALSKSKVFFGYYIDKGAIPYGYGYPNEYLLTNNGTSGSAAVTFSILENMKGASFYSMLCAPAAHKVEIGHTGAFFNSMWTGLGANVGGPELYSGYFKDWTPLRTLTRKWNGGYVYQRAGGGSGAYGRIGASAAMLLHLALPYRKLYITGKDQDESIWVKGAAAKAITDLPKVSYADLTTKELFDYLGHKIPMVRRRAASEIAKRKGDFTNNLANLLKGTRHQKIGACHTLAELKEKAAPVTEDLMAIVRNKKEELWVRNRALMALSGNADISRKYVPELLEMIVADIPEDRRRHLEMKIGQTITAIAEKPYLKKNDKGFVFAAAKKLLTHPRMRGRTEGMKLIENIDLKDFHIFANPVIHVIRNQDPEYHTYHYDRPTKYGLELLDRLNIKEGMDLCLETFYPGIWGQKYRISGKRGRLAYIQKYGSNAKPYIKQLKALKLGVSGNSAIEAIENSEVTRDLISLEKAIRIGSGAE